jgi:hypothetical protein
LTYSSSSLDRRQQETRGDVDLLLLLLQWLFRASSVANAAARAVASAALLRGRGSFFLGPFPRRRGAFELGLVILSPMPMFHVGELQPTSVLLSPEEPSPASWSVASAADSGALAGAATGAIVRAFSLRRVVSVAAAAPRRRSAPLMSTFIAFSPVSLDFFCVTFVGRSCCFSPPRGLMAVRPIKLIFSRAQRNCQRYVSAMVRYFRKRLFILPRIYWRGPTVSQFLRTSHNEF